MGRNRKRQLQKARDFSLLQNSKVNIYIYITYLGFLSRVAAGEGSAGEGWRVSRRGFSPRVRTGLGVVGSCVRVRKG